MQPPGNPHAARQLRPRHRAVNVTFSKRGQAAEPEGRMANHLYYGDNLNVLRESIKSDSVDLIYLDPPFNSNVWIS